MKDQFEISIKADGEGTPVEALVINDAGHEIRVPLLANLMQEDSRYHEADMNDERSPSF